MTTRITRRTALAGATVLGASSLLATRSAAQDGYPPPQPVPESNGLKLYTTVDDVRLFGMQKFSFPWPEPAAPFAGLHFAFELITFENAYAADPQRVRLTRKKDSLVFAVDGFTWAGGQEKRAGKLTARLQRHPDGAICWTVETDFPEPVKAIKTIVRGLPRGRFSMGANDWQELGEIDVKAEYPPLAGALATPLMAIEAATDRRVWGISAIQKEVRPARFVFQPGKAAYRAELIYEQAGWQPMGKVRTHEWEIVTTPDFETLAQRHFGRMERNLNIPSDFQQRRDAPDWMKQLSMVLTIHGMHWSGYIFNDYARQLEILRWVATRTDPRHVLAFLTAWDGRYYWNYPKYELDGRMGGEKGFRRLIDEGRKLGFRFAPMYGSNIANQQLPVFQKMHDAATKTTDDFRMMLPSGVDWNGDRRDEPMPFMNLAVPSYRNHLIERISHMIETYGVESYFLDLAGTWNNNVEGDMNLGLKALVDELARRHPGVPVIGEMLYDAQMSYIPMTHVGRFGAYRGWFSKREAVFSHLISSAPGRGSTGVHEAGFGYPLVVSEDQGSVPTIIFVDDTFSDQHEATARNIAAANRRFRKRGGRT